MLFVDWGVRQMRGMQHFLGGWISLNFLTYGLLSSTNVRERQDANWNGPRGESRFALEG